MTRVTEALANGIGDGHGSGPVKTEFGSNPDIQEMSAVGSTSQTQPSIGATATSAQQDGSGKAARQGVCVH
jgi:hypothetical protein